MSHENAARIAFNDFKGTGIDTDVFNVAAQYIPDKRILTNIRNEYLVYHKILNRNHQLEEAGFNNSRLLASIIYKNTYLDDTNRLQSGGSNLDYIYNASRTIINHNINKLNRRISENTVSLKRCTVQGKESYAKNLGKELLSYIKEMFGYTSFDSETITIGNNNQSYDFNDLDTVQFWEDIRNSANDTKIAFDLYGSNGYGWVKEDFTYTKRKLSEILHHPIDIEFREKSEIKKNETDSARCREKIEQLRGYDFKELIAEDDTYCAYFDKYGKPDSAGRNWSLKDFVRQLYGADGLPMALLSHGWINRNYIQYSTIFDTKLTTSARDFIYHHVDSNNPDYGFKLSEEDAGGVVEEISQRGKFLFEEPRLLNFDILDYLAGGQDRKTTELFGIQIAYLSKLEPTSKKFLAEYLNAEDVHNQDKIVQTITPTCPNILKFLTEEEFEEDRRLQYMNDALQNLSKNIDYAGDNKTKDTIKDFLSKHIASSPYSDESLSAEQVVPLVELGNEIGLHVDSLRNLSTVLVGDFIRLGLYKYTRGNICQASDSPTVLLSLDEMRVRAQLDDDENTGANRLYQDTLDNLDDFLEFLGENEYSIQSDNDETLLEVLRDVLAKNAETTMIDALLQHAADYVIVNNIAYNGKNGRPYLSDERWKPFVLPLLRNDRMLPTLRNIEACIRDFSQEDETATTKKGDGENPEEILKHFLRNKVIVGTGEASDDERKEVAVWIVNAGEPYSEIQNQLDDILGSIPNPQLEPDQIDLQKLATPEDYAELISASVIPDDSTSWNYIADQDWTFKKPYIEHSHDFVTYMSEVIDANEMCKVLTLNINNEKVVENIWKNLDQYLLKADSDILFTACNNALHKLNMPPLTYTNLKLIEEQKNLKDWQFADLLVPSLKSLHLPQILILLSLCTDDYANLVCFEYGRRVINLPDTPSSHSLYEYFNRQKPNGLPMLELAKHQKENFLCVKRPRPKEWKVSENI